MTMMMSWRTDPFFLFISEFAFWKFLASITHTHRHKSKRKSIGFLYWEKKHQSFVCWQFHQSINQSERKNLKLNNSLSSSLQWSFFLFCNSKWKNGKNLLTFFFVSLLDRSIDRWVIETLPFSPSLCVCVCVYSFFHALMLQTLISRKEFIKQLPITIWRDRTGPS